ncbi:MAG: hypothetical protein V4714_13610 [Bacteroidota bacterium]
MMKMSIHRKVGKSTYHFQFEGKNLYEVVKESEKLSFPDIHKCGLCGKDNIVLGTRHAQNKYKYTFIRCQDCRAQLIFGQTKEDADVFYLRRREDKKFDWHIYEPEEEEENSMEEYSTAPASKQTNHRSADNRRESTSGTRKPVMAK